VRAGQMLTNVPNLRRHEMEVVEQPFCRGGHKLPRPDIVRQGSVRLTQDASVVVEPGKDVAGPASRARIDGEAGREGQGALFQALDAEQLVAERSLRRARPRRPQPPNEGGHVIGRTLAFGAAGDMRPLKNALVRAES